MIGKVRRVLLADEWCPVSEGTFRLVPFDYGGAKESVLGFEFEREGSVHLSAADPVVNVVVVSGPLSSILAVEYERGKASATATAIPGKRP